MIDTTKTLRAHRWTRWAMIAGAVIVLLLLLLAAFPVGMFKGAVERRLSDRFDAPVQIGSIERDSLFSFAPVVSVRNVRIAQPAWAGRGDFLHLGSASVRVPVFALLGGGFSPDSVRIDGLRVALVRSAEGRNNWSRNRKDRREPRKNSSSLRNLVVTDARFTLADAKRELTLAGPISIDAKDGLRIAGRGLFLGTPVTVKAQGGRILGVDPHAPYPFNATFTSPALDMTIAGNMAGTLDTSHFSATAQVSAPTLKNFDRMIEAGLFGSQPIALAGKIRHDGHDWYIDTMTATVGRSHMKATASVLKRDGRTAIDATIHASQFDFDDLSDNRGLAVSAASRARNGARVLPPTRINLSKIGKTDGRIHFSADRLLSRTSTVFRSLRGDLTLDHRLLTVRNIVATLDSGQLTGTGIVDHRSGNPKLSIDARIDGVTLESMIGNGDAITGRVRGRIRLAGQGDTVREALSRANGKAAIVATDGSVKALFADVLGQDLGHAIGQAFGGAKERVPLRCFVADFHAANGVLTPQPLAIDTGSSTGRGSGRIMLDAERIDLTLAGASRHSSILRIVDPIRIGGTLSVPSIAVAGLGAGPKPQSGGIVRVITR